jgi:hypothetical protein
MVATCDIDIADVLVWNTAGAWSIERRLTDSFRGSFLLEWSPDGSMLLAIEGETSGGIAAIFIYETSTWTLIRTIFIGSREFDTLAWSPGSEYLAASGGRLPRATIHIFNTSTCEILQELEVTGGSTTNALDWNPDGCQLAVTRQDSTVDLYSTVTWEVLETLVGHNTTVASIAYSDDGVNLASGGKERTFLIWDAFVTTPAPTITPMLDPSSMPIPTVEASCTLCEGGATPPDPSTAFSYFYRESAETIETNSGALAAAEFFRIKQGEWCYDDQLSYGLDQCKCEPPDDADFVLMDLRRTHLLIAESCQREQDSLNQVASDSDLCRVRHAGSGIDCGCGVGPSQVLPPEEQCDLYASELSVGLDQSRAAFTFLPASTSSCEGSQVLESEKLQCCIMVAPVTQTPVAPSPASSPVTNTPTPAASSSRTMNLPLPFVGRMPGVIWTLLD